MHNRRGRPKGSATKAERRHVKLAPDADAALKDIAKRMGWTLTSTVERAILFARSCKDFGSIREAR